MGDMTTPQALAIGIVSGVVVGAAAALVSFYKLIERKLP